MKISFPFVACVRTAGRKKICQIVAVKFLQGGLGPFRGLDAPRAPKTNDNPDLWPSQRPNREGKGVRGVTFSGGAAPGYSRHALPGLDRKLRPCSTLRRRTPLTKRLALRRRFTVTERS